MELGSDLCRQNRSVGSASKGSGLFGQFFGKNLGVQIDADAHHHPVISSRFQRGQGFGQNPADLSSLAVQVIDPFYKDLLFGITLQNLGHRNSGIGRNRRQSL